MTANTTEVVLGMLAMTLPLSFSLLPTQITLKLSITVKPLANFSCTNPITVYYCKVASIIHTAALAGLKPNLNFIAT